MNPSDDQSGMNENGVRQNPPRVAFTLVEMVVTLAVACILMIAVVAFLVNGVVSTAKTTAINDSTTKGRYVFEHLSREMSRANDIYTSNFTGPDPSYVAAATPTPGNPGTGYQGFSYLLPVGGQATNTNIIPITSGSSPGVTLSLLASAAPDYLVPQAGDYIQFPGLTIGTNGIGALIAGVSSPGSTNGAGNWTIQLQGALYSLAGISSDSSNDIPAAEVMTILRQRAYSIQVDPSTGDRQLWWYPATASMPTTMVVAK
jgi:type II secretory pathway pseudopilin PulG